MNFMVAIDFTGSNGHFKDYQSLHYLKDQAAGGGSSQYSRAIEEIGKIIEVYSATQQFACWGFGASVDRKAVSHCFNLNFNPNNASVAGTKGIVNAYRYALKSERLAFSGPTLFEWIIQRASGIAAQNKKHDQVYNVLLILTDGVINDKVKTVDAIVGAGDLPLSIIIVGIGAANFSTMEYLDADDSPLVSTKGKMMTRDIVQFVPYRDVVKQGQGALAKEVLAEIPEQVTGYYQKMGIKPQAPLEEQKDDEGLYRAQTTLFSQATLNANQLESSINKLDIGSGNLSSAPTINTSSNFPKIDEEVLPPGWQKKLDPGSGKYFYVDHNTKKTQWHPPVAQAPAPPPPAYEGGEQPGASV